MKKALTINFIFCMIQLTHAQNKLSEGIIEFSYDHSGYDSTGSTISRFPINEKIYFKEGKTYRKKTYGEGKVVDEFYDKENNQTNYIYTLDDIKRSIVMKDGQSMNLLQRLKSLIRDSIITTSEQKIIQGYLCKKKILWIAHAKDTTQTELWITDSIEIAHPLDNQDMNGIHGTTLESFIHFGNKIIHQLCIKISSMKPSDDFFIIPKDAEEGNIKDVAPLIFNK